MHGSQRLYVNWKKSLYAAFFFKFWKRGKQQWWQICGLRGLGLRKGDWLQRNAGSRCDDTVGTYREGKNQTEAKKVVAKLAVIFPTESNQSKHILNREWEVYLSTFRSCVKRDDTERSHMSPATTQGSLVKLQTKFWQRQWEKKMCKKMSYRLRHCLP